MKTTLILCDSPEALQAFASGLGFDLDLSGATYEMNSKEGWLLIEDPLEDGDNITYRLVNGHLQFEATGVEL